MSIHNRYVFFWAGIRIAQINSNGSAGRDWLSALPYRPSSLPNAMGRSLTHRQTDLVVFRQPAFQNRVQQLNRIELGNLPQSLKFLHVGLRDFYRNISVFHGFPFVPTTLGKLYLPAFASSSFMPELRAVAVRFL